MFVITNLIEPRFGKMILDYLIGKKTVHSYFFKLPLGSDCLELCFRTVADPIILQKNQSLSNQILKKNWANLI